MLTIVRNNEANKKEEKIQVIDGINRENLKTESE